MTDATFEPIRITGCDEKKVRRSTRRKGIYIFPFSLSAKPPSEWADAFEDIWRSHRKTSTKPKPDAYFRKSELVIECLLADLKAHFAVFSNNVEAANKASKNPSRATVILPAFEKAGEKPWLLTPASR